LLLLKSGYLFAPFVSHESLIESRKVDYYKVLAKTQQTWKTSHEDMSYWIIFFLETVKQQVVKAISLSKTDNIDIHLSEIQAKVWNTILSHTDISRQEIQKETGISENTIKQVINKLISMKKIERR
jgi:Fic family protein